LASAFPQAFPSSSSPSSVVRIIVLGAAGMLGHKVFQVLRQRYPETLGTMVGPRDAQPFRKVELLQSGDVLEDVDATDRRALEKTLADRRPDVVVNCIGIVKQREAAKAAVPSIEINSLLPHVLVEICSGWGGRVIHFSTDCVFDGKRGNYTEADRPDADDLYGKSKAVGEIGLAGEANALTLRTSIIGRELATFQSLLEWFLAQRGREIRGFSRAIYAGVTTNHLAAVVSRIIADHPRLSGLYQVASTPISKLELLGLLREAYGLRVEITPDDSFVCDRSMRGDKLREAIGYTAPPWPELVRELAADPTPYDRWRP
jgi:dTDP-4-dehydrorhamnose reductase